MMKPVDATVLAELDLLITSTLHHAFDLLLRDGVRPQDYHVVTALLFLQHEGPLDRLNEIDPKWKKAELMSRIGEEMRDHPNRTVYSAFSSVIGSISDVGFARLVSLINEVDRSLALHFERWIEAANGIGAKSETRVYGEIATPPEIARLLIELAGLPSQASVYNPFGGLATFGLHLKNDHGYWGEEQNGQAAAIGLIRLMAHSRSGAFSFGEGDSISHWNPGGGKHDLIIANPPWNVRVESRMPEVGKTWSLESFFLQRAVPDLKPGGKAIAVVPLGFLTSARQDQRYIVDWLLKEDLLDTVISFPGGLLANTSVPFAALVIDHGKKRPGTVRFVKADRFVEQEGRRLRRLNDQALLAALRSGDTPDIIRTVQNEEIRAHGGMLAPGRYFMSEVTHQGEPLSSMVAPLKLTPPDQDAVTSFVRIADLSSDPLEHLLHADRIEKREASRHARVLDRSSLLLAMRWSDLRPTWFQFDGKPLTVTTDILAVEVDEKKVFVPYLIHELCTPNVRDQVAKLNRGVTIPSLRKADVLSIRIELPTLEEQKAKVKGLREAYVAAQVEKARMSAEQHGVQLQQFGNTVSFKHRLGTPLLSVGSGIDTLRISLDRLQPDWRDHIVSAREQLTLGAIMENVAYELQRISAMLDADSMELDVTQYPLKPMDLVTYAKKAVRRAQADLNGEHEVNFFISADVKEQLKGKAPILCNSALLDTAMDALVDNARRHAFAQDQGPHKLDIRVGMRMEDKLTWLVLTVANSGRPFPEGFGLERYVRKNVHAGPTGHTGIGGYHVHEIVQHHKGLLELLTAPKLMGPYATEIDLLFPLAH